MEKSPHSPIAHLFLDATYTKVRMHDIVSDCAVFVAVGIDAETGRRMVLGVSVGLFIHPKPEALSLNTAVDYWRKRVAFVELTRYPIEYKR